MEEQEDKSIISFNKGRLLNQIADCINISLGHYFNHNSQAIKEALILSISSLDSQNNLLTINEARTMLRCSRATLHRYRTQSGLPFIKRGKTVLFERKDLETLLKKITLRKK